MARTTHARFGTYQVAFRFPEESMRTYHFAFSFLEFRCGTSMQPGREGDWYGKREERMNRGHGGRQVCKGEGGRQIRGRVGWDGRGLFFSEFTLFSRLNGWAS